MMDEAQIQEIVDRVMREIGQPDAARPGVRTEPGAVQPVAPARAPVSDYGSPPAPATQGQDGVFATLDEAVAAATTAFQRLEAMPLEIRKDMVAHMRRAGRENATILAEIAVEETGMGRVEDKVLKNSPFSGSPPQSFRGIFFCPQGQSKYPSRWPGGCPFPGSAFRQIRYALPSL